MMANILEHVIYPKAGFCRRSLGEKEQPDQHLFGDSADIKVSCFALNFEDNFLKIYY